MCVLPDGSLHDVDLDTNGDIVMRLRSIDQARRAWRRAALRYAARTLHELGYVGAARALETVASGVPDARPDFE